MKPAASFIPEPDVSSARGLPARLGWAASAVLAALVLRWVLFPVEDGLAYLTFYPAVLLVFHMAGSAAGMAAAVASAVLAYWQFLPPYGAFEPSPVKLTASAFFLASSFLIAWLVRRLDQSKVSLLASEQRYLGMLQDQSEFIARFRVDGTVNFVNEAFCRYFGVDREAVVGHRWQPVAWPDDVPMVERQLARLSPAEPLVTIENRVLVQGPADAEGGLPAPQVRWCQFANRGIFDAQGRLIEIQAIGRDITERKRLEAQLQESLAEYRALYDEAPCGYHTQDEQGLFLQVNATELQWLGCSKETVVGRRAFPDFLDPSDRERLTGALAQLRRSGRIDHVVLTLRPAQGDARRVSLSMTRAVTGSAADGPIRAVLHDINDLLREQDLRNEAERQARELTELLQERTDMLHVLAHEVRQPLNTAAAVLQRAIASTGEPTGRADLAHATGVIGDVLAHVDNTLTVAALLASPDRVERSDVDIDVLLALSTADLPDDQRPQVRIDRRTRTRTASMDLGLMRLALRNLLNNAIQHSPTGAAVTVRLSDSDEPLAIVIDVCDAGAGIDPAVLPVLFQRGARGPASPQRRSHGLGLFIVRRVMELHGGMATLRSTGPQGTTMRLLLPQGQDD